MKMMRFAILSMALPFLAEAACPYASGGCASSPSESGCNGKTVIVKRGGCCCRRYWDVYPRPEFNPPDDIATLPEREQLRFVKIFRLVPDQVKVKSTQNYAGRMAFMRSTQYTSITNKLAAKLARSANMLATEPSVTAGEVMRMCSDTIIYGRSLIMGNMGQISITDLAEKYHFKNARKTIDRLDDSKNFRHGLKSGYPRNEPECRDFETLAKTVNPSQWQAFLDRITALNEKHSLKNNVNLPAGGNAVSKAQHYDRYDNSYSQLMPGDLKVIPNRDRLRLSKCLNCLPVQVLAVANQDYSKRRAYLTSTRYAEDRSRLVARLVKVKSNLEADPAVTPNEVLKVCDEVIRFGRPLVFGDMRDVSLSNLAARYGFKHVETFIIRVEDEKSAKRGLSCVYPTENPEYADFDKLANAAYADRWRQFKNRLSDLNGGLARRMAGRRRK